MSLPEKFKAYLPDFKAPKAQIEAYLELCKGDLSKSALGDKYDYAVCLLAAHRIAMLSIEGELEAESLGQHSKSYSKLTGLEKTSYGQILKGLLNQTPGFMVVT